MFIYIFQAISVGNELNNFEENGDQGLEEALVRDMVIIKQLP